VGARENVGGREEKTRNEGMKEGSNERAARLIIRRKERYCKEEKDGGRKDKRGYRNQRIINVVTQMGRNAESFVLMCSRAGI